MKMAKKPETPQEAQELSTEQLALELINQYNILMQCQHNIRAINQEVEKRKQAKEAAIK